jgi:4a-hydroxytetrahydrobiopterin dehydratase
MNTLRDRHCIRIEKGTAPLDEGSVRELSTQLKDWELAGDGKSISRTIRFKDFYQTMAFVNALAWIANQEDHHPDLEVGYNHCTIHYSTHAAQGLTINDFICAAKIDALLI